MWELDHKESWEPKNWCLWTVVLEETAESPLDCKEIQPVHPKNQSWRFIEGLMLNWSFNALATWYEELTFWKRPWYWERLKAGEGDDRGWDGWIVSPTRWTWVWVSSESWWCTGKPGVLQPMGVAKSRTRLSDWTALNTYTCIHTYLHVCAYLCIHMHVYTHVYMHASIHARTQYFTSC